MKLAATLITAVALLVPTAVAAVCCVEVTVSGGCDSLDLREAGWWNSDICAPAGAKNVLSTESRAAMGLLDLGECCCFAPDAVGCRSLW